MNFEGGQQSGNKAGSATELNLEYAASIILQVFQSFDVDGGGTLHRRELRQLLRQCGAKLTSKQCDNIIDQLDTDGDGEMNFAEFMSFLGRLYQLQFYGNDPGDFWANSKATTRSSSSQPQHHPMAPPTPPGPRPTERPLPTPPAPPALPRPRATGPTPPRPYPRR